MGKQLNFNLPEIDREATRDAVEGALERYRMFLLMEPEERLPKVTQTFTLVPPSNTNGFHSSTEDAAVHNVDQELSMQKHIKRIQKAVNRLSYQERGIILKRYMLEDDVFDYEVYNELGMSERKYYRVKGKAFYKLAFMLKIEVMIENEKVS
ncbi:ArpU family phage packaging/lysis transcriptional regulator [Pseudalkalibacillus caeni]|uniref:ArpU family transcriptional regulator n=1 Tax=Exobacillus caeni TaxID=2574798 RepID=A0A5R9F5R7_9BACL|nr:ArpU family phage packaging/lysis transcriptional regulator [Pseudalkalibacillus caeni]TLS37750.1 ArpU family transcriptional regulator [Pseudalkalibacillus caeni]